MVVIYALAFWSMSTLEIFDTPGYLIFLYAFAIATPLAILILTTGPDSRSKVLKHLAGGLLGGLIPLGILVNIGMGYVDPWLVVFFTVLGGVIGWSVTLSHRSIFGFSHKENVLDDE